jgi:hypothetical protein
VSILDFHKKSGVMLRQRSCIAPSDVRCTRPWGRLQGPDPTTERPSASNLAICPFSVFGSQRRLSDAASLCAICVGKKRVVSIGL